MEHTTNNSHYHSSSNILSSLPTNKENFLTHRLYKNYSHLRLDRKFCNSQSQNLTRNVGDSLVKASSNLMSSFSRKHSIEESVLIPKITNRLRELEHSRETRLQIDKGKFMLLGSPSAPSLDTSVLTVNRRHLFSKLDSLETPVPMLSYDEPSMIETKVDKEGSEATERLKQRFKKHKKKDSIKPTKITSYQSRNNVQDQSDQALTPYDFIKLVNDDPDISDEFCYLKKVNNPYDLRIVDYQAAAGDDSKLSNSKGHVGSLRHRSEHNVFNKKPVLPSKAQCITISSRGITYFSKDQSVFVTLNEWQRQAALYHRLSQLNFFKDYKLWKNFLAWKKYLRRTAMKKVSDKLRSELLLADSQLRVTLLTAREETLKIESQIKYFKIEESEKELPSAEQLKAEQDSYRSNEFEQNMQSIKQGVKNLVVQACRHSLMQFKEEQKKEMESRFKGDSKNAYGQESNKMDHHYTDEATCKTHYKKLNRFVKLVDYMVVTGKLGMILESTGHLRSRVAEKNSDYYREVIKSNEKYSYKGKQWFICELFFDELTHELTFEPSRTRLRTIFEEIVTKGVARVCKKHTMIADSPELQCFKVDQNENADHSEQVFDIQDLLHSNEQFKEESKQLSAQIETTFDYVERYSKRLHEYLEIFFQNTAEDMDSYYKKDHNIIRKSIARWKDENTRLNAIIEEHQASIALISTIKLKERIKNCAQERLETLYRMLPSMLTSQTEQITQLMVQYREEIKTKPKNVREFIRFDENVKIIDGQLDDLSASISGISFLSAIIKENRNAIGEPVESLKSKENRVVEAQKLLTGLRNTIHQANMDFSKTQGDFREQVRKMGPVLVKRVDTLYAQITEFNLNNPEKDLNINVEFLERSKKQLDSMFEESKQIGAFEKSLDMDVTEQVQLNSFASYFSNLYNLWTLQQRFLSFQQTISAKQFLTICAVQDEAHFAEFTEGLDNVIDRLSERKSSDSEYYTFSEKDEATLNEFHQLLVGFQPVMEMLRHLNDSILKQKEWVDIRQTLVGATGDESLLLHRDDPQYTVRYLMDKNIEAHCQYFESVCIKAKKQQQLVNILKKVSGFWTSTMIAYEPYKDFKDVYLLLPNEQLYSKIEDCRVQLDIIYKSKYVECVQVEADRQSKMLNTLEDLLSEWFRYQKNWLYLQPLFCNSYFKGFLKELKSFTTADNNWRKIMKMSKEFSTKKWTESENAIATLRTNNCTFETLKKMVGDMLEKKREVFNRLYLLSDGELIRMLSTYKDVRSLQPFLSTIFQSVQRFDFNPTDKDIQRSDVPTGVVSFDDETLTFKTFRPGSEMEECLKILDESIRVSVRASVKVCVNALEKDSFQRRKWIKQHISQAIVLGEMFQFTKLVETDYLSSNPGQEMEYDLSQLLMLQLIQLSEAHQILQEQQLPVNKKLLYSLIVQSLANRDVVQLLRRENVQTVADFHWQQQLKVNYFNETFVVKVFQMELPYGYEFLGINERPVSTPQTEKAKLQLVLETAQGGTFITNPSLQLVRDLAYISGKTVTNFDPQYLESRTLFNMIRGACSTGSWLAFNNISSLPSEILKQVCYYIDTIKLALLKKESACVLEGASVSLSKQFTVFNVSCSNISREVSDRFRSVGHFAVDNSIYLCAQLEKHGLLDAAQDFSKDLTTLIAVCNEYFSTPELTFTVNDALKVIVASSQINRKMQKATVTQLLVADLLKAVAKYFKVPERMTKRAFEQVLPGKYWVEDMNAAPVNSNALKQPQPLRNIEKRPTLVVLNRKEVNWVQLSQDHDSICLKVKQIWDFDAILTDLRSRRKSLVLPSGLCSNPKVLFGQQTDEFLWKNGVLTSFLLANDGEKKLVVFENLPTEVYEFMSAALKEKQLSLSDGQRIRLDGHTNAIFIFSGEEATKVNTSLVSAVVALEEPAHVFASYFAKETNQCGLTPSQRDYLVQLDTENSQKLLTSISKHISGQALELNDYNVLLNCCKLIRSLLLSYEPPLPAINDRGIEKLYAWGMFVSVYSLLENKSTLDKLCKSFAEVLRLEHIKVSNIFENNLSFPVPQGLFRPVNWNMPAIPRQLSSHVDLIRLSMHASQPLVIIGKSGSLKSETVTIISSLDPTENSVLIRVTPDTTLDQFIALLLKKLLLKKTCTGYYFESIFKAMPKLSIFVDNANINPKITEFIIRLSTLRQLWSCEEEVLATLSANITIHMVFCGKAYFDPNLLRSSTHLPLMFNQEPMQLLTECYSSIFLPTVEENLLKQLMEATNLIIQEKCPSFTGHDLSKLFRALTHYRPLQRQSWCLEVIESVCASKQLANNRQQTTLEICSYFHVQVDSLPKKRINGNMIRVYPCNRKWVLDQAELLTQKRCISLEKTENWTTMVDNEHTTPLCVHFVGHSPNIFTNMQHIEDLLHSSADSETHTKTMFVMDTDERSYKQIYERFFGCVDRFFRVSYQPATPKDELRKELFKLIKSEELIEELLRQYQVASKYVEVDEETLENIFIEFKSIKGRQEAHLITHVKQLEACLHRYNDVLEKKRLLGLDSESNRSNHQARMNEQLQYQAKTKSETSILNSLKKEHFELKLHLSEKQDEAKTLRTEDKHDQADKVQKTCRQIEQKLNKVKDSMDSQTKLLAGIEQAAEDCKKSELQLSGDLQSMEERHAFLDRTIELAGYFQPDWSMELEKSNSYLTEQLDRVCLRFAVEKHILGLCESHAVRDNLRRLLFEDHKQHTKLQEEIVIDPSKVVKIQGGKFQAQSFLLRLIEAGHKASMYSQTEQIQQDSIVVVIEEELDESLADNSEYFSKLNCHKVFLVGQYSSGVGLPQSEPCTHLERSVMETLEVELYRQYSSNVATELECRQVMARKKLELRILMAKSKKCLMEDKETLTVIERTASDAAITNEHIQISRENIQQALLAFRERYSLLLTTLHQFYATVRELMKFEKSYNISEELFSQWCCVVLQPATLAEQTPPIESVPLEARQIDLVDVSSKLLRIVLQGIRPQDQSVVRLLFKFKEEKVPSWLLELLTKGKHKLTEKEFSDIITEILRREDCQGILPNIVKISKEASSIYQHHNQSVFSSLECLLLQALLGDRSFGQSLEEYIGTSSFTATEPLVTLPLTPITVIEARNSLDRENIIQRINEEAQKREVPILKWIALNQYTLDAQALKDGYWLMACVKGPIYTSKLRKLEEQIRYSKEKKARLFVFVDSFAAYPEECLGGCLKVCGSSAHPATSLSEHILSYYKEVQANFEPFTPLQRQMTLASSLLVGVMHHNLSWLPVNYSELAQSLRSAVREQNSQDWASLAETICYRFGIYLHDCKRQPALKILRYLTCKILDGAFLTDFMQDAYGCVLEETLKLPFEELQIQLTTYFSVGIELADLGVSEQLLNQLNSQRTGALLQFLSRYQPQQLQPNPAPLECETLAMIDDYLALVPAQIVFDRPVTSYESIEERLIDDTTLFNHTVGLLATKLNTLRDQLAKGIMLDTHARDSVKSLSHDILPREFSIDHQQTSFSLLMAILRKKADYLSLVVDSKFRPKLYSLRKFMRPKRILERLIQLEKKRLKLPNGQTYLRLLSSQPEGINENAFYLSEILLENCVHDIQKMCLEEHPEPNSLLPGPVMQLMVTDVLPPSNNYTSVEVDELVGETRTHLLSLLVPTRKKHEYPIEMALIVSNPNE